MNNVTPEHLVTITQGATPVQIITMVLLGILVLGAVIAVVRWVIDLKLGTLPQDLKEIRTSLDALKNDVTKLDSKLWSDSDIKRAMDAAIKDHIEHCPHNCHPQ